MQFCVKITLEHGLAQESHPTVCKNRPAAQTGELFENVCTQFVAELSSLLSIIIFMSFSMRPEIMAVHF